MTTMIDRVARAIAMRNEGWTKNAKDYIPHARAAIEAMREPTPAVIDGMRENIGPLVEMWRAAIDASLAEHQP